MDPSVGREPYARPDQSSGRLFLKLSCLAGVIGLLLFILLPRVFISRHPRSSNEASASGALKTLVYAQTDFRNNSGSPPSYARTLEQLRSGAGGGGVRYIDDSLGSGSKSGYQFSLTAGADTAGAIYAWSAEAHPGKYQKTGIRSFYIDETGILLGNDIGGAPGNSTMPEI